MRFSGTFVPAEGEAVPRSVQELEGVEMTLAILAEQSAVARVPESLSAIESGETGVDLATVRRDPARRRDRQMTGRPYR